jgi:hypothetical protein
VRASFCFYLSPRMVQVEVAIATAQAHSDVDTVVQSTMWFLTGACGAVMKWPYGCGVALKHLVASDVPCAT